MESRWYLMPGQTLEGTKISDRRKALHITSDAWENITGHLDKKRLAEEAIMKERAKKKAMKEESQAMVDAWPNSLLNLFRRKEEARIKNIEMKKEERMQNFFEMRKEQEKERQKYVDDMRLKAYRRTGFPREIDAAFVAAEFIFEREKAVELKEMLKQRQREVEAEYAEKVRIGAENEKLENKEKARKRREKNEEFAKLYLKEVQDLKERENNEKKARIDAEIIDDINAAKEIEDIKKVKRQEVQEYTNMVEERLQNHRRIVNERKRIEEQEDKDKDEIISIQVAARNRMDCLMKKKKKELQDLFIARSVAISGIVPAIEKEKAEREEVLLEKAWAEKEKQEIEKLQAKAEYAQRLREERIKERSRIVEKAEKKKAEEIEARKWAMVNRFKITEYEKMYQKEKKAKKWEQILGYRKDLQDQMAEKREIWNNEEMQNDAATKKEQERIDANDKKFFEFADHVKDLIKSRSGRTTIPLEKVVQNYKKINNLPLKQDRKCIHLTEKYRSKPGKMTHSPESDPNYNKCKANSEQLYS